MLLALRGAGAGLLLSLWGIDGLRHIPLPGGMPIKLNVEFDFASLLFAAGAANSPGAAACAMPSWVSRLPSRSSCWSSPASS